MLSAIHQGSLVYIIDKTKGIKFKIGEVVNKTEPKLDFQSSMNLNPIGYFDLNVKTDSDNYEFKRVSGDAVTVNYNQGNVIISETKEALVPIIETILHNSKQATDEDYIKLNKQNIEDCDIILKQLNPIYAKEQERDGEIQDLKAKVAGIDDKLDKLFNLINNK
ncbi:MAG: hypothetical protein MJ209_00110 [archaeon]|nr:hypothetical protein [archaeon]